MGYHSNDPGKEKTGALLPRHASKRPNLFVAPAASEYRDTVIAADRVIARVTGLTTAMKELALYATSAWSIGVGPSSWSPPARGRVRKRGGECSAVEDNPGTSPGLIGRDWFDHSNGRTHS